MLSKQEIESHFSKLPSPRVGSIAFNGSEYVIRANCIDMFNEIFSLVKPENILEIGTHMGHSSLIMLGLSNANIVSVDIGQEWCDKENLQAVQITLDGIFPNRFLSICGDSNNIETINKVKGLSKKFNFIFIDGNHTYKYCKKDIDTAIELNIPYIAIDDYTTCQDMRDAAKDSDLELIKIYENIHNGANIGIGFFKNKGYKN